MTEEIIPTNGTSAEDVAYAKKVKEIYIDGVNVALCERRIGKNNFCRYFKRNCADNNYNCIWKKCLRLEQENKQMKSALEEIKRVVRLAHKVEDYLLGQDYTDLVDRIEKEINEVLK